jgi:hypothetical protein
MGEKETTKPSVTISTETEKWLHETYPDALSTQEAFRCAIADARKINQTHDIYLVEADSEHGGE